MTLTNLCDRLAFGVFLLSVFIDEDMLFSLFLSLYSLFLICALLSLSQIQIHAQCALSEEDCMWAPSPDPSPIKPLSDVVL